MAFRVNNHRSVKRSIPRRSIQSLNTHFYDGQLKTNELVQQVYAQQRIQHASLQEQKIQYFARLCQDVLQNPHVLSKYRPTAHEAIKKIQQSIRGPGNYDNSNGMFADDVLYLICKKIEETKNVDAIVYLSEQLSDIITSGQCPQGRSTRLFQVLFALSTKIESPVKPEQTDTNDAKHDELAN